MDNVGDVLTRRVSQKHCGRVYGVEYMYNAIRISRRIRVSFCFLHRLLLPHEILLKSRKDDIFYEVVLNLNFMGGPSKSSPSGSELLIVVLSVTSSVPVLMNLDNLQHGIFRG